MNTKITTMTALVEYAKTFNNLLITEQGSTVIWVKCSDVVARTIVSEGNCEIVWDRGNILCLRPMTAEMAAWTGPVTMINGKYAF